MVDRAGRTPLHYAAMEADDTAVRALLAAGESPNVQDRQGFTPLHLAALEHAASAAVALLDAGAHVDVENAIGNTPLFVAVFNSRGRGELVELLLARGADPQRVNHSGQTPVGLARLIANYDVARFFGGV